MLRPDYQEFLRLARDSTLVPVAKSVTADLLTPVSAFSAIAHNELGAFLLESVEGGEKIGRYTFLGVRPYMQVQARGNEITIVRGRKRERRTGNIFQTVQQLLRQHRPASMPELPPFTAGAVGYFSYDVVRHLETIGEHAKDDLHIPDCVLMFFDRLLAFDHLRHQIQIIAAADVTAENPRRAYERAVGDIAALEKRLAAGFRTARQHRPPGGKLQVRSNTSRETFLSNVRRMKEYIFAGDIFQAVLSQRLEFQPGAPPFDLYRALRMVNPSPYMYFLRFADLDGKSDARKEPLHVLGSSPEMLVRVGGRKLEYRPIAGTHPRGRDEAEDRRLEQQMRADEKER